MRIIPREAEPNPGAPAADSSANLEASPKAGSAWLLVAPLLVALFNIWTTVSPNDFWPHVAAGRWVAQHGHVPNTNLFAWGAPLNAPYAYPSWGAGWLLYQTLHFTGLSGIVVLRALCVACAWGILGVLAFRRVRRTAPGLGAVTSARIVCLVSLISFGLAATNLDARPQTLILPLFALTLWAIFEIDAVARQRGAARIALLAGAALSAAIWTNFHGSFVLGLALPMLALVAEVAGVRSGRGSRQSATAFLIWLVAGACGTLLNPRGVGVLDYVTQLNANSTVQRLIYEWQAPRFGEGPGTLFYGSAAILLVLALLLTFSKEYRAGHSSPLAGLGRAGLRAGEVLLLLAVFYLATRSIRSILWFALLLVPCASAMGALYWDRRSAAANPARQTRLAPCRAATVLCGLLGLGLLVSLPPVRARWLPPALGSGYSKSPWGEVPYVLDASTPVETANYLMVHRKRGPRKLWNDMGQGAYLIWALPPGMTQCDSRIELFSNQFWRDYLTVSRGGPTAEAMLKREGITDILCDANAQPGLVKSLKRSPDWMVTSFGENKLFQR